MSLRICTAVDAGMSFEGGVVHEPGQGIVVTDWAAGQVQRRMGKHGAVVRVSSAGDWTIAPRPEAFRAGQTLLAWRGLAYGDQLVWGGLLAIIKRRHPGIRIVNYCHPGMAAELWQGVDGLPFEVRLDPIPFADWRQADWHLVGEGLNEDDIEPDQPDVWTGHLRAAGIDPESVPWSERRALVPVTAQDRAAAVALLSGSGDASGGRGTCEAPRTPRGMQSAADTEAGGAAAASASPRPALVAAMGDAIRPTAGGAGVAGCGPVTDAVPSSLPLGCGGTPLRSGQRIALWQLAASTPIRSYPPEPTREAMRGLVMAGFRVLVIGTDDQVAEYGPLPAGVERIGAPLRVLFAAVGLADCVVCPDSVFGWAAQGLGTPCVSLWGSFLPGDRVGPECSHRPLVGRADCVPCRKHEKPWLKPGCPAHGGGYCRAIAAIPPQAIVEQVLASARRP